LQIGIAPSHREAVPRGGKFVEKNTQKKGSPIPTPQESPWDREAAPGRYEKFN